MDRNVIVITAGRVLQMVIMFLTYRVLSSVLSVEAMGSYYFLLSISAAFGLIYANPIGMYANRMLHSWQRHGVMLRNLNTVVKSLFVGSLLTIPFLFIFKEKFSYEVTNWSFIVLILVFYVFSSSFNGTFVPSLNLLGLPKHFVVWTLLTNVSGLILSYLFIKFISHDPLFWLLGQGVGFLLFGVVAYFVIRVKNPQKEEVEKALNHIRLKRVSKFALPIVITNLAVWVLGQSFRFFYKENIDLTILGELAFGLGLATALCVAIEYLFQQLYLPKFYSQINDSTLDKGMVWNDLFNSLLPSYILFIFYIIGLAPFIMRILADAKFKNSGYYLALGTGIEFLRMVGNIFNMATQSEMKTHKAIGPYLTGGAIALSGVLFICYHPEYVKLTPFCLMAGYLASCLLLARSVKQMIVIRLSTKVIFQTFLSALVFLIPFALYKYSDSLLNSILVNAFFGLILIFFVYKSYVSNKVTA